MNARVLLIEARRNLEDAVRRRPDHASYLEILGEACLVCGDSLAAIPHLEKARAREGSVRATWLLSWAYVHAGRLADVERLVRELIEEGRGCPRAVYVRGLARFKRRAFDLAIADLREAMPEEVDVPFFRRELARGLLGAALAQGAAGGGPRPQAQRQHLLNEAVALLKSGDIDDPASAPERRYLAGCALLELGESTRALSLLAETDYPSRAEASLRRAAAAAREGDTLTARVCFTEAREGADLAAASDPAEAVAALPAPAIAPLGLGPLTSPELVRLVVRGDGWPATPWMRTSDQGARRSARASAAPMMFEDVEARVEALRAALRRTRTDWNALAEGVAILERGGIGPDLRRRLLQALAVGLHVDLKRPAAEVERLAPLLERTRRAAPGVAFPRWYLARLHFRGGAWEQAVAEAAGLPGALGASPAVRNLIGRALEKLTRFEEAEAAYRDSLARAQEQPTIRFALGRLLLARYRESFPA